MNYKTAIEIVSNVKREKKPIDISTWAQYGLKDGKIKYLNPPQELTEEEKQQEIIDKLYKISFAIETNRYNYMINYDKLHGNGAYERLYYLEPIYDDLDEDEDENEDEDEDKNKDENLSDYE